VGWIHLSLSFNKHPITETSYHLGLLLALLLELEDLELRFELGLGLLRGLLFGDRDLLLLGLALRLEDDDLFLEGERDLLRTGGLLLRYLTGDRFRRMGDLR